MNLPESLHRNARAQAAQGGVLLNQLFATVLAGKLAALGAQDCLASRSQLALKAGFGCALAQVPDEEPARAKGKA